MSFYENLAWEQTNDLIGFKPKFTPRCPMCRARPWPRREMVLRNSSLILSIQQEDGTEKKIPVIRYNYKCPWCEFVCAFIVPTTDEYLQKVLGWRGNKTHYFPGVEEWKKNRIIAEKLKSLGYF
jgi:hypothetical protein